MLKKAVLIFHSLFLNSYAIEKLPSSAPLDTFSPPPIHKSQKLYPTQDLEMPSIDLDNEKKEYGYQFKDHGQFGKLTHAELSKITHLTQQNDQTPIILWLGVGYGAQVVDFIEKEKYPDNTLFVVNDIHHANLQDLETYAQVTKNNNIIIMPGDASQLFACKEFLNLLNKRKLTGIVAFNLFHYISPLQMLKILGYAKQHLDLLYGHLFLTHSNDKGLPSLEKTGELPPLISLLELATHIQARTKNLLIENKFFFLQNYIPNNIDFFPTPFTVVSDENWQRLMKEMGYSATCNSYANFAGSPLNTIGIIATVNCNNPDNSKNQFLRNVYAEAINYKQNLEKLFNGRHWEVVKGNDNVVLVTLMGENSYDANELADFIKKTGLIITCGGTGKITKK